MSGGPLRFQCQKTAATLTKKGDTSVCEVHKSYGVREILVQRGVFITPTVVEDIVTRPLVLGDQSSCTHLNAVMAEMQAAGVDLQQLSQRYDEVLVHFGTDGAATCDLVIAYIRVLTEPLGNVTMVDSTTCLMHACNRIVADHVTSSKFDLSGIFSLSKLLCIGTYWDDFAQAVVAEALSDVKWDPFCGPPDGQQELHKRVIKLTCPELCQHPRVQRDVEAALQVLNGRWDRRPMAHHCVLASGGVPCCANETIAREKVTQALLDLLLTAKPKIPCTTRWLTTVNCVGWWSLGCMVSSIFPRAFLRLFQAPASAAQLGVAAAEQLARQPGHAGSDSEHPDDAFHVKVGKRISRGRRNMGNPDFDFHLGLSMTMLRPLHSVMGLLFNASKLDYNKTHNMMTSLVSAMDLCMTRLVALMEDHTRDPAGKWFALYLTRGGGDVFSEATVRLYVRQQMMRICGGFAMRLTEPMNDPDVQLWLAVEADNDDLILTCSAACQSLGCCRPPHTLQFYEWLRQASLEDLKLAKLSWAPTILCTERDHSGNQRRCRQQQGRTRVWRRQTAAYVCKQVAARWSRGHPERLAALRRRSTLSFRQFRSKMRGAAGRRSGGNPLFDFVNEGVAHLRRHGAEGPLRAEKRALAESYRQLDPMAKRKQLDTFQAKRQQQRQQVEQHPEDEDLVVQLPDTFWGMGSSLWPVAPQFFDRIVQEQSVAAARGGLRRVASELLPETSLVVPPARRRLSLPAKSRDCCHHRHRHFCVTRDADISHAVMACLSHFRTWETAALAGEVVLRFYDSAAVGLDTRDRSRDIHGTFACLRGNPKYTAMYLLSSPEDVGRQEDFPFRLSDVVLLQGHMARPSGRARDEKSFCMVSSWQLAVMLCRRFENGAIAERLEYEVTNTLKTLVVTGTKQIFGNIKEPPLQDLQPVRPRKLRGLAVLKPAKPRAKADDVDEETSWWMQALTQQAAPKVPEALPSDNEDSGAEQEQWYVDKVCAWRRVAEASSSLRTQVLRRRVKPAAIARLPATSSSATASAAASSFVPPSAAPPPPPAPPAARRGSRLCPARQLQGNWDTFRIEGFGSIKIDRARPSLNAHCACVGTDAPQDHRTPLVSECRMNRAPSKLPLGLLVAWLWVGADCTDRAAHVDKQGVLKFDEETRRRAREWLTHQPALLPLLQFEAEKAGLSLEEVIEPRVIG